MLMFKNLDGAALACGNKWIQGGTYTGDEAIMKIHKKLFSGIPLLYLLILIGTHGLSGLKPKVLITEKCVWYN